MGFRFDIDSITPTSSGGGSSQIESLNITPTTSVQTITAPSGIDGYNPINVSAVTNSIDANIIAENIKKDISILGIIGSYEGSGGGSGVNAIDPSTYTHYFNFTKPYDEEAISKAQIIFASYNSTYSPNYTQIIASNAEIGIGISNFDMRYFSNLESAKFPKLKYIMGNIWWSGSTSYINSKITEVEYPELLSVWLLTDSLLGFCSALTSFTVPKLIRVDGNLLAIVRNCAALTSIKLPSLEYCLPQIAFDCAALKYVNAPKCRCLDGIIQLNVIYNCTALECLILGDISDINKYILDVNSRAYNNFTTFVFNVTQVPVLSDVAYIKYSSSRLPYFAPDGDGSIYVPDALVNDFKVATNWATLAEFIKPISEFVNTWEN